MCSLHLKFSGTYRPSAETQIRWQTACDSALAVAGSFDGGRMRDPCPRLPVYLVVAPSPVSVLLEEIALPPGETYSDTLRLGVYRPDFEEWPGYLELAGEFLVGRGPRDGRSATRLGKRQLAIAIPLP
jgi:hypothetical protein